MPGILQFLLKGSTAHHHKYENKFSINLIVGNNLKWTFPRKFCFSNIICNIMKQSILVKTCFMKLNCFDFSAQL